MEQRPEHQAHLAELMSKALTLMMYQTEREHSAHPLQTDLVAKLSAARDAAKALSRALDPQTSG